MTTKTIAIKQACALLACIGCLLVLPQVARAQTPLPGWNMGDTLEATWSGAPAPTQALINAVHKAGFNTIRIPCAWVYNSTNGTINSSYMTEVTNVVNWSLADGMHVVINEHWDNGWFEDNGFTSYSSSINSELISYWTQIANNFKNTSTNLMFACANEPAASTQAETTVLFKYYQNWVTAVRATGGNNASRYLIVEGPSTNIGDTAAYVTPSTMPTDPAKKLVLEVHEYDPYQFTAMTSDASWGNMFYFWGAAYHVTKKLTNRNSTWGEESWIQSEYNTMKTDFVAKGVPVYIGEYRAAQKPAESDLTGQYITQNYNSATYWNKYLENSLNTYSLGGTCWDTPGSLFNWSNGAVVDQTMINACLGKSAVAPISGL